MSARILVLFILMTVLFPIASVDARGDLFVGDSAEHAVMGHGGIYIPTSYTGISETYTMVVGNERNIPATAVQIILPQGMQFVSAQEPNNWKISVLQPPSVRTTVLIWNGSSIAKGKSEQFTFSVKNPAEGFVYYFVVVQSYIGGDNDVSRPWVQIITPTNIAGIEYSTIAFLVIAMGMALPFVEMIFLRIIKKSF